MATWQYRTNTTINDPSDGNVRGNDLDLTLATALALSHKTEQGGDASAAIAALVIGDTFTMTAKTDPARWVRFDVTALPIASTGWSSIAVVARASQTPTFTDAEEVTLLRIAPAW